MKITSQRDGFSLVEVTLAIGIIGFALLAIVGMIPVGQQSARDAADSTRISLIEQDAFARVRARLNYDAAFTTPGNVFPPPPTSPSFYYTNEGVFFSDSADLDAAISTATQNHDPFPNYAVTVNVGLTFSNALPNVTIATLKPVTLSVGYPLDSQGNVVGPTVNGAQPNAARQTSTFYVRKP